MTELIAIQLRSAALMLYCGLTCGMLYRVINGFGHLLSKSFFTDSVLELTSLLIIGYCITAFLYCSSWGKIAPQDVVCYFAGLWLWRRLYGEEGESSSGVRKDSQGAEYQQRTGRTKKEKRKKTRINWVKMIGITVAAVFIVMAAMSVKNIFDLRAEEKVLMAENAELLQLKEEMLLKLDNVNSDEFIEEQARKELKLVKGNELIFYFPEDWEVKEQEAKDSKKETEKKDE